MADSHEQDIAEWIGGRQTKGSGNQWHSQMDAKNGINKIPFPIAGDGKATLGKSVGVSREMWRKAEEQSFGEIPALFLRFYRDSTLRTVDQDLVVLSADDFKRMLEAARKWSEYEAMVAVGLGEHSRSNYPLQSYVPVCTESSE
jgi:alkyl hydroperoxide reductase subunit AhpC